MRFLADMGVSGRIVSWLREQGYDAIHLRDEGLQRLPDREISGKAVAEDRVTPSFDSGFGEIAALSGGEKCGVVVFRLRNTRTPHVISRLDSVLIASSSYLEEGAAVVVEETRHRIRRPPVGEGRAVRSEAPRSFRQPVPPGLPTPARAWRLQPHRGRNRRGAARPDPTHGLERVS